MPRAQVLDDGVTVVGSDPGKFARTLAAAGITDPILQADYGQAQALLTHHGTSYAQATVLLPPSKRPYVWALYGFARYADEFVDSLVATDPAGLREFAAHFCTAAKPLLTEPVSTLTGERLTAAGLNHFGRAMVHTMATWDIPLATVDAFFESMLMDITVTSYATYADLDRYMYGSAAVIGLQMLPLLEPTSPDAAWHAQKLGEAFQLTNFLRDVGEDLDRGRCYLPVETLTKHQVTITELQRCRTLRITPPKVRAAVLELAAVNQKLYDQARPGIEMLDPRAQVGIRCADALYSGILDQVIAADGDVLPARVRVPKWRRTQLIAKTLMPGRGGESRRVSRPANSR